MSKKFCPAEVLHGGCETLDPRRPRAHGEGRDWATILAGDDQWGEQWLRNVNNGL